MTWTSVNYTLIMKTGVSFNWKIISTDFNIITIIFYKVLLSCNWKFYEFITWIIFNRLQMKIQESFRSDKVCWVYQWIINLYFYNKKQTEKSIECINIWINAENENISGYA